jgi:hypothetical protein
VSLNEDRGGITGKMPVPRVLRQSLVEPRGKERAAAAAKLFPTMTYLALVPLVLTGCCGPSGSQTPPSGMSPKVGAWALPEPEIKCCGCCAVAADSSGGMAKGFVSLFDGKTTKGWTGYRMDHVPKAWSVADGVLTCTPGSEDADLRTEEQYGDFELRLDYKISESGNSGIMYRSTEDHDASWQTGPEYQILDDQGEHMPVDSVNSTGAAYDFFGPKGKAAHPAGEWNEVRIVAKGNHIEHWMNGKKIVEYEIGSPAWTDIYKKSKFAEFPDFAKHPKGYIVLQDHGNAVSFRGIRIKKL